MVINTKSTTKPSANKTDDKQVWKVRPLENFQDEQGDVAKQAAQDYDYDAEAKQLCKNAKQAWEELTKLDVSLIDDFLRCAADKLIEAKQPLIAINTEEVNLAKAGGMQEHLLNRLLLDSSKIEAMAKALRSIAQMPSVIWQTSELKEQPSGLKIAKMQVPIGVIGIIYEARPHVTADAAAVAIKAGNATILRGGSESYKTSLAIGKILTLALKQIGLPEHVIQVMPTSDRRAVRALISQNEGLDLIIPRGGKSLVSAIIEQSSVPILKHLAGNCHIYVDNKANLEMAIDVIVNGKCYRPAICGTVETVLIHKDVERVLPSLIDALKGNGVTVRGCSKTRSLVSGLEKASEEDWYTEYLDKTLAVKVVDNIQQAVKHINEYSSQHTESIITESEDNANLFLRQVDSGSVMWNVPTCFADGGEYGLGTEIGISTDKLHARGPVGVEGLTSSKFVVIGNGQLRQ